MRNLTVDGVNIEITNINANILIESGALTGTEDDLFLNPDHSFTYEEVKILMDPGKVTDYVA